MTEYNPASVQASHMIDTACLSVTLVSRPLGWRAQIVYADAMTLFKHSAVTDLHYDHETVSGWFDYICDEKTPCITTARFDGARRVCLKRCYPGRHQV